MDLLGPAINKLEAAGETLLANTLKGLTSQQATLLQSVLTAEDHAQQDAATLLQPFLDRFDKLLTMGEQIVPHLNSALDTVGAFKGGFTAIPNQTTTVEVKG